MSFGKGDMSKENMYHDPNKDMPAIRRFAAPPPPPPQPMHQHHGGHGEQPHPHPQQQQLECFSDEVDSRGTPEPKKEPAGGGGGSGAHLASGGGGDGSSIEVAKKRRGRPPGSKNKPKPPVVITREAEPAAAMRPHVIEIPGGRDIAEALSRFAGRRGLGICVLAGTGAVANVSLRHPCSPATAALAPPGLAAPAAVVVVQGRYEILSISATFLPPAMAAAMDMAPQAAAAMAAAGISISLAGPHGQIVGGAVAGPLYAATTVVVVAAAFTNPTFHRLPIADEDASVSVSGSADAVADEHRAHPHPHQQHQPEPPEQRHLRRQPPHLAASTSGAPPVEPCGVSIYGCHAQPQPQEVIWPPAAHQAPRPPPPY
ncbi:AT-hook motif nuclear-localized protein 17 [Brachypodium distachyon]|uniref:PPC domain-containing protein n=1 Tax=Brachypodium distachyon TaxID=15368 RepID=I1IQV1_BRADI|nr:AT-hook motif nuclear-localized protein 17 [Brachypodium distachyon]KQJ90567.1 hypothetical protein BRADI_4g32490v3 [Brachypodium distachyon]|eukprot:XP_003576620.1 AT-hook motif nuclear-localized protein 17 [Brachypodium distachyon]